jgi:hypothetical protein
MCDSVDHSIERRHERAGEPTDDVGFDPDPDSATDVAGQGQSFSDADRDALYDPPARKWFQQAPEGLVNLARDTTYAAYGLGLAVRWRPRRAVLLGHMRSGSSLLTQIVASNPDVLGYGELYLPYRRRLSLWAVNGKTAWTGETRWPTASVVIDKVLHDYLASPADFSELAEHLEVMFLIRDPASTLPSLAAAFGLSDQAAFDYYTTRLRTLEACASTLATDQSIALTHQDLIERTADSLALVRDHLRLETPLSERYQPRTRGGDLSPNILAGRILRDENKVVRHEAVVDESVLAAAHSVFERTRSTLASRCRTLW